MSQSGGFLSILVALKFQINKELFSSLLASGNYKRGPSSTWKDMSLVLTDLSLERQDASRGG